ncbi:zinc finger CCHC domain-containing protein, partial [Trifolium pratense]
MYNAQELIPCAADSKIACILFVHYCNVVPYIEISGQRKSLIGRSNVAAIKESPELGSAVGCYGLEIIDAPSRCFNCGSYSHALRECTRPRDNVAVNNARKQLKSRRNQNSSSRNPTRYYQDSPTGKYAGLRPGALDDATRQLLGLG